MKLFANSLIKIAQNLYNTSMQDRYNRPENNSVESKSTDTPNKYEATRKSYAPRLKALNFKPVKFETAPPASLKVTPKAFDYTAFSKNTKFSDLASHIVNRESGGVNYISKVPNKNKTQDYGLYQINDLNLSRKTSGGKLADAWDPIFEKYYQHYQKNFAGKSIDGVKYTKFDTDSLDVNTRRKLLQVKHKDFNNTSNSLSYDLSEQLYNQRGIGQWASKDKVIDDYKASSQVASSD